MTDHMPPPDARCATCRWARVQSERCIVLDLGHERVRTVKRLRCMNNRPPLDVLADSFCPDWDAKPEE